MPKLNRLFTYITLLTLLTFLPACGGEPERAAVAQAPLPTATSQPTAEPTPIPPTSSPPPTATPIPVPPTPTSPVIVSNEVETADDALTESTEPTEPTPTAISPTPTTTPDPLDFINGIPVKEIVVLPPEVIENAKSIFSAGQTLGRSANRFSKLGDSVIANGDFITRFDTPDAYTLGPYDHLQPTIDYFDGSWLRYGVGIRIGLSAWGVFDPMWADKDWCDPNEVMIDCEFRLNNPSIVLIHLGTNDVNATFERFLRQTVEHSIDNGVIPILLTKADRFEETVYDEENRNNRILREVAADYQIPLVDFDIVAETLPNRGLTDDNVHLNGPMQHDYNLDVVYEKGHSVHNLTVLMMLDELRQQVILAEENG